MKFLIGIEPGTDAMAYGVVVPNLPGFIWAYVNVPVEKYLGSAEKVNVTIPSVILRRI